MHNDIFSIGSVTIHGYGLMIAIGFVCAVLIGMYRAKKYGLSSDETINIGLLVVVCGFVGAKLLFVIVNFKDFLKSPLEVFASEGFVVYGGIIFGVLAGLIYCKCRKLSFLSYFDLVLPCVAIAQGFGRIGCFLAGCCYGMETNSAMGVIFPEGSFAPAGVRLIPTQLISSVGNFIIAIVLFAFARKTKYKGDVGALYLLLYGVGRFTIEIFRSDLRGEVGILSTSQFISIFIVIAAIVIFVINHRRKIPADKYIAKNPKENQD